VGSSVAEETKEGLASSSLLINDFHRVAFDRSNEKAQLLKAYKHLSLHSSIADQQSTNFVLVSGDAGSGKSCVASSLKDTVTKDGGYFVTGRFLMNNEEPFAAFVAAFTDFTRQVLERNQAAEMKQAIQVAVKAEQSMLINMIPALSQILDDVPTTTSGIPSQDLLMRFGFVFRLFVGAISTPQRPLVLVLDDLQNADECSLTLLSNVVSDISNNDVLFVCTCVNRLDPSNAVCQMLRQIEENHVKITNIAITCVTNDQIADMVSKLLKIPKDKSNKLATDILMKTSGNALFVVEYIRMLYEDGLIFYDNKTEQWTWKEQDLSRYLNCRCVKSLMATKMDRVPQQLVELLKVASFLGSKIDTKVLSTAFSASSVDMHLQDCVERGLVVHSTTGNYLFANNYVREAYFELVPEENRPEFHLAIGRRLLRNFGQEELDQHVYIVLNQLRRGSCLITNQTERYSVASLCLLAGKKAVTASSFRQAGAYLSFGLSLLGRDCWKDKYDLSVDLYSSNAEVLYILGDYDRMDAMIQDILANATRSFHDQLRAWYIRVISLGAQDRAIEAIKDGMYVLSELGENLPKNPTLGLPLLLEFHSIKRKLRGMTDEMILRLPRMTNSSKFAAMQMLNLLFIQAYLAKTELYPYIGLRLVKLSLTYGLCAVSPFGFAMMGMMICGVSNDISNGVRYGNLALRMLDIFHAREWIPRVYVIVHGTLMPWKVPIRESLSPLHDAYDVGRECGDIEYALLAINLYVFNSFDTGRKLQELAEETKEFTRVIKLHKHGLALALIKPFARLIGAMTGSVDYHEAMHISQEYEEELLKRDDHCIAIVAFQRMLIAYAYGELEAAEVCAKECYKTFKNLPMATFEVCQVESFVALVSISLLKSRRNKVLGRRPHFTIVRRVVRRLRKWVDENPNNCQGKFFILLAELAALKCDVKRARGLYTIAMASTRSENFLFEHALQGERAGKFMLQSGEVSIARDFFQKAHGAYLRWGAFGRAKHLKEEVNQLFGGDKVL
jgi:predicted ATPase